MKTSTIQGKLHRGEGAINVYRRMVVGETGIIDFILYELYMTLIAPLPGSLGTSLRRIFVPLFFADSGKETRLMQDVTFRRPGQIRLGSNISIGKGVVLDVKSGAGSIEIHDNVYIGSNTILSCPGGTMIIGRGTRIGSSCRLGSLCGLTVGSNCTLGNSSCIVGAGHAYEDMKTPIIEQSLTCKGPSSIGDNVTIGKETTVLDGVQIASDVTIAEGSLINKNVTSRESEHVFAVFS